MTTSPLVRVLAAAALLAVTACSSAPSDNAVAAPSDTAATTATTAAADGVTVDVVNIAFKPAEIRVLRSTEVTWTNSDKDVAHTVTAGVGGSNAVPGVSEAEESKPDGTFDGDLPAGGEFAFTFNELGTFSYYCEIHPSMRATVIVE